VAILQRCGEPENHRKPLACSRDER